VLLSSPWSASVGMHAYGWNRSTRCVSVSLCPLGRGVPLWRVLHACGSFMHADTSQC
jgi:hypothetical protein